MAREAIHRCVLLLVAVEAITHVQVNDADRDGLFGHVSVAAFAVDPGSGMRRVVKLNVRVRSVVVHALPGNVFAPLQVRSELFDFRTVGSNDLMAGHAKPHARQLRVGAAIGARMAVEALEPRCKVDLVRVGDWLYRRRPAAEEVSHRVKRGAMRGRKRGGALPCARCRLNLLRQHGPS